MASDKPTEEQLDFAKRIWSFPGDNWSPDAETYLYMGELVAARDAALLQPFRELADALDKEAITLWERVRECEEEGETARARGAYGSHSAARSAAGRLRALLASAEGKKSDG